MLSLMCVLLSGEGVTSKHRISEGLTQARTWLLPPRDASRTSPCPHHGSARAGYSACCEPAHWCLTGRDTRRPSPDCGQLGSARDRRELLLATRHAAVRAGEAVARATFGRLLPPGRGLDLSRPSDHGRGAEPDSLRLSTTAPSWSYLRGRAPGSARRPRRSARGALTRAW